MWWNALCSTRWNTALPPDTLRDDYLGIVLGTRRSTQNFGNFSFHLSASFIQDSPEEFIDPVSRHVLLGIAVLAFIVPPVSADLFPASGPVVSGKTARLRFGRAAAPKNAPLAVKRAIWAANKLRSKPYRYGGGHKSFDDRVTIVRARSPMRLAPPGCSLLQ
jgi:hypothetical protein